MKHERDFKIYMEHATEAELLETLPPTQLLNGRDLMGIIYRYHPKTGEEALKPQVYMDILSLIYTLRREWGWLEEPQK